MHPVSGITLKQESLWQRLMILELGASAPASAAILTSFFVGIGLGSWWGGKLAASFPRAITFYWILELGIAVFGLAVPTFLQLQSWFYIELAAHVGVETALGFCLRFMLAVLAALPATLCMGATIPTMNRLLAEQRDQVGTGVALAFGMNTLGAVLGCLAGSIILLPHLGVSQTLGVAATINGLVGLTALVGFTRKAGRDSSVALKLQPVVGIGEVGFFAPIAIEPGESYSVSCWTKTSLREDAQAGLVVLELGQRIVAGEQFSDVMLERLITGVHGPTLRGGAMGATECANWIALMPSGFSTGAVNGLG